MDVRSQGSKKSFYQNKYLQYRALVESTKDFSNKLSSAQNSPSKSAPAPTPEKEKSSAPKPEAEKTTEKVLTEKSHKEKSHKVKVKGYKAPAATTAAARRASRVGIALERQLIHYAVGARTEAEQAHSNDSRSTKHRAHRITHA